MKCILWERMATSVTLRFLVQLRSYLDDRTHMCIDEVYFLLLMPAADYNSTSRLSHYSFNHNA